MRNNITKSIVCFVTLAFSFGLAAEPESSPDILQIFVSILPQKYFVERIVGEKAHVEVMVGPGQSPETYDPSPKQLLKLADAGIYFSIGVPFETVWMSRISDVNDQLEIVDSAAKAIKVEQSLQDPHIWLSPEAAQLIAEQILATLVHADPVNSDIYWANYSELKADLEQLDKDIKEIFGEWLGRGSFLVMHPAWGSFAQAYGLEQIAIEKEGKSPAAKSLQELIEVARAKKIQRVFIQDQHSSHMAETVAKAIGAEVSRLDPLAEDYLTNLREVAVAMAQSFRKMEP